MEVSIALAVYNGAEHLKEQLESYINQIRQPDELVVTDDCSTDDTVSILKKFATGAPFPVHIHVNKKNLGVIGNFDAAIELCSGDIIFPSDHDDVWLPSKIQLITKEFERNPEIGLIFANAQIVDEDLNPFNTTIRDRLISDEELKKIENGNLIDVLVKKIVVGGATSAFRSEYRKFFSPIPTHLSYIHDGWISLIVASMSATSYIIEPTLEYRQHSLQQTNVLWGGEDESKKNRIEICEEGFTLNEEKKRDMLYLLETLVGIKRQQPENICLKRAIKVVEIQLEIAKQAIAHFTIRKDLEQLGLKRFYQVGKESLSGRYHKFSKGFASIAKDLIYR